MKFADHAGADESDAKPLPLSHGEFVLVVSLVRTKCNRLPASKFDLASASIHFMANQCKRPLVSCARRSARTWVALLFEQLATTAGLIRRSCTLAADRFGAA